MVDGTLKRNRVDQINVLRSLELELGAPEENALVVAAYACLNKGKDLLEGLYTRFSVPEFVLATNSCDGVGINANIDDRGYTQVGASGVKIRGQAAGTFPPLLAAV